MRTVWWAPGPTDSWTQPRRWRWNCACLLRLTWNRTGSRISQSTRELSAWTSSILIRERSGDSNSRTGPSRSGPDMGCSYPPLRNPVGSYRGPVEFGDDRCTFGITSLTYPGPAQRRPSTGIQPVKLAPDRFAFEIPTPACLNSDKQLPGLGAQSGFDRFKDSLPNMTGSGLRNELPGRSKGYDPTRPPEAKLMDTVARLQLEMEALKFG